KLLRDPDKARAYGRAGRKLMLERFTLSRTAKDLRDLYGRLLSAEEKRRAFYNPLVSLLRLIAFIPLLAYLTFRLYLIDVYFGVYFPIHLSRILFRIRLISARNYYRVRSLISRVRRAITRGMRIFTNSD
ncbi:MAG TPA: hypothetical protein VM095_05475, partial [Pyrinomonadaceae bacterium]|nr:hypothetical protein [Pyrinomonadaceae bacterium]